MKLKLNNIKEQENKFIPFKLMGSFETGIIRSVKTIPNTKGSYLVKPIKV